MNNSQCCVKSRLQQTNNTKIFLSFERKEVTNVPYNIFFLQDEHAIVAFLNGSQVTVSQNGSCNKGYTK